MAQTPTILFVYAHPDDEQAVVATMARYRRQGFRVGLLCATRGELGEIAPGVDATPETLGMVRELELLQAMEVAGVSDVYFLDFRDSGMAGTPANQDAAAYITVPAEEAVGRMVRVFRDYRPHVVVTFDPSGVYHHPDHVAVHHHASAAYQAAANPRAYPEAGAPWRPLRLYYSALSRREIRVMARWLRENAPDMPSNGMDWERLGVPDEEITITFDAREFVELKHSSMMAHASQMPPDSPFVRITGDRRAAWGSKEHFILAAGVPLPPGGPHDDLFTGLEI